MDPQSHKTTTHVQRSQIRSLNSKNTGAEHSPMGERACLSPVFSSAGAQPAISNNHLFAVEKVGNGIWAALPPFHGLGGGVLDLAL